MKYIVAQIIVDNRAVATDRPFTYLVKKEMKESIDEGMRVVVPFGRGNRLIKGIIIKLEKFEGDITKLKYIEEILDDKPIIAKKMIDLSLWMSEYYLSSYIDSLNTVMPPGDFKKINTFISLVDDVDIESNSLSEIELEIIKLLEKKKSVSLEEIKQYLNYKSINKHIKKLEKKGFINTDFEIQTKINKKYKKYVCLKNKDLPLDKQIEIVGSRAFKQIEVLKYLYNKKEMSLKELLMKANTYSSTVKGLEKKGLIYTKNKEVFRNPIPQDIKKYKKIKLSKAQQNCVDTIYNEIETNGENNKYLIHGVTGSGKTEVYLQLIERVINLNKQVIALVPEISLTPQTVERFVGRFGNNVAVLHSKLSLGERFDEWRKIKNGKVQIAVGARSAIFAPFNNLGLIVIDEEHETSYKSSMNPKYNTIEVAEKRCELENAYLVLGTATPSVETYYRVENNEIELLNLPNRVNKKRMPSIKIVDMREELMKGNKTIFSSKLFTAIYENLEKKQQTILFLNRRGYSTFISCRKCGYVLKCNNCDVSMTYHRWENLLKCHYCGKVERPPILCPMCKSNYIKYFGIGTQKVEEEIRKYFPKARVARMDIDTTTKKGSHLKILKRMKREEIDILIGTQMVSKGLDFPNVTLVGIVAADTSLNLPDYRSSERTFQLITQVAGRSGRGEVNGNVIVQTYNPEHFSIQTAKKHDFDNFYRNEILLRKEFEFPPYVKLVSIVAYGENEKKVISELKNVYTDMNKCLEKCKKTKNTIHIYGPNPAPLEKLKNNYRWQILIKCKNEELKLLKHIIKRVCINNSNNTSKYVKFSIDVNPNSIL